MLRLNSIKSRILALALGAALLPALITGWLSYQQNRRVLADKITESLVATAGQTARELDLWLKERLYDVRVLASSYEVSENLETITAGRAGRDRALERLTEYLRSVQERFPDHRALVVAAPSGTVLASGGIAPDEAPAVDPDVLAELQGGHAVLGTPYRDPDTGDAAMRLAVPIQSAGGRYLGAMRATVAVRPVEALLAQFVPETGGHVYLVDAGGDVIASSRLADTVARLPPAALEELRATDDPTVDFIGPDGQGMLGTLAAVPRTELAVIAAAARGTAFAEIRALRNTTALTVLLLLVVVGGLAYLVGTFIVRPLDRLTAAAGRVAAGDLSVDVPVRGGGEVAYLTGVFNDMVAQVRQSRFSLEYRSITDGLTGLFNRRHIMEVLQGETQRSRRHDRVFSVLMIDVDHFKRYNDEYGHPAGDEVLQRVAQVLTGALREVDRVGRYGGEEFLALLPETARAQAAEAAERIRERLQAEAFLPAGEPVPVTLSIGVAEFPQDGETPEAVVATADAALYRAKREGRDRVVAAG